jgi:hypothetical protein
VNIPTGEATIGPFFPPRYVDEGANDLSVFEGRKAKGEVIEIRGRVVQNDGSPLENLIVEIWQADASGSIAIQSIHAMHRPIRTSRLGACRYRSRRQVFIPQHPAGRHAGQGAAHQFHADSTRG